MIGKWKVFISRGYGEGGETREYPRMIIGKPIVAPPQSACSETYLVIGSYDKQEEADNLSKYLKTKFLRFLVGLRKNTQDISKEKFSFVPIMPMDKTWTDKELFKYFNLNDEETTFIDTLIRPIDELV
jgi:site-specific DNA-methyltransferase (adenine-specific)